MKTNYKIINMGADESTIGANKSTEVLSIWETVENMPDEKNPIIIRVYSM